MSDDPVTHAIDQQVNSRRIEEVDDCLTPTDQLLLSIAVSLKRIADSLDGTSGISLAQAIENAIGTGMFHGFQNLKR